MTTNSNTHYVAFLYLLLGTWLALAITASALEVFHAGTRFAFFAPLPLGLAVVLPMVAFLVWYWRSSRFRDFVLSLNPGALAYLQSFRLAGFVFLVLEAHGLLPAVFAWPAGWGDIFIGATAPLVALNWAANPARRTTFLAWNIFGMADLVNAVTLGVLASPSGFLGHGVTTDIVSVLPLSLVPTFAVPLLFNVHIISIAQSMRACRAEHVAQMTS